MEKRGAPAGCEVEAIDDAYPCALEGVERGVEIFDVDRQMVQALAAPREEARQEPVRPDALHQLEAVVADPHVQQTEALVVAAVGLDLHRAREMALEEAGGGRESLERERKMVHLPAHAVLRDGSAPTRHRELRDVRLLPELNQRAERRAGMNERRLVTVASVEAIDDAHPFALQPLERGLERVDLQRQMVKPFAPVVEKPLDEAAGPGALDQLDLEVADREVRPAELGGRAVAVLLRLVGSCGKVLEEEVERAVDRSDGNRHVIDAQARSVHPGQARGASKSSQFALALDFRASPARYHAA